MNRITALCVHRPVFITMITLIVVLLGVESLRRLPIDLLPEVDYPTVTVSVSYANASPEEMETLVAEPVEQAVAAVPGIKEITSTSAEGISNTRVTFNWGVDIDSAANDLRDRLDRIVNRLPDEADRPQLRKFDSASFPIVILGASANLDPVELRRIIDDQVRYRLEQVPGVAAIDIWGGLEREIQVNLDLEKVKALAIPLNSILDTIRQSNLNVPAGSVERGNFDITMRTPGEFRNLDEIADLVVAVRNNAPVRLGQIAEISDTHQRVTREVRINGEPGVRLAIRKQSDTNTVEVAQGVLREIERINRDLSVVSVVPVVDTSEYIQNSIDNVSRAVVFGGILAILVLLFFLRSLRSTLIIATAIPISIVATFTLVFLGGFTLNLMTLGGLALGVGMMVDNAIVVLENIYRVRAEEGLAGEPEEAAIRGTREVSGAITASTLTTLVIFLPLLFIEGIMGRMFGQLGYVVIFSLLCSLLVALTFIPMLAARLLPIGDNGHGILAAPARLIGRALKSVESGYQALLAEVLRMRLLTVGLIVLVFAGTLTLAPLIGTEFMPSADQGEVRVNMEMEVGTRLEIVDQMMRRIEAIVDEEVPEKISVVASAGGSSWRPSDSARGNVRIQLVPRDQRERSSEDVAADLRRSLTGIPGVTVRTRAGQGLRILNFGVNQEDNLTVEVRGYDFDTLAALAEQTQQMLEAIEGITDVRIGRDQGVPQELVRIDRDRAADLGLNVATISRALETSIAGSRAGEFRDQGNQHRILVRLRDSERLDLEEILDLVITNGNGDPVVLRNVVNVEEGTGPNVVERRNQERVVYVSANVAGRDFGSVLGDVQTRMSEIPHPIGYQLMLSGDVEEQREAALELLISFIVAIVLVYMVMASLYESLVDPLVVMFSVPMAAIGVILILFLTDTTLNSQSFIGCIMLGGIVVNNAVLIVDQATQLREKLRTVEAVMEAGRRRLRPILMTTATTVLGLVPLALGIGDGAEAQAPLARAVIGGMLSSGIITLLLIPIVYTFFHGPKSKAELREEKLARRRATLAVNTPAPERSYATSSTVET